MKFKVSYNSLHTGTTPETVEADTYRDQGDWTEFLRGDVPILRVRSATVARVEEDKGQTPPG